MLFWVVGSKGAFGAKKVPNIYEVDIDSVKVWGQLNMIKFPILWHLGLFRPFFRGRKVENQRCKWLNTPKMYPKKTSDLGVYSRKQFTLRDKNSLIYLKKLSVLFFFLAGVAVEFSYWKKKFFLLLFFTILFFVVVFKRTTHEGWIVHEVLSGNRVILRNGDERKTCELFGLSAPKLARKEDDTEAVIKWMFFFQEKKFNLFKKTHLTVFYLSNFNAHTFKISICFPHRLKILDFFLFLHVFF